MPKEICERIFGRTCRALTDSSFPRVQSQKGCCRSCGGRLYKYCWEQTDEEKKRVKDKRKERRHWEGKFYLEQVQREGNARRARLGLPLIDYQSPQGESDRDSGPTSASGPVAAAITSETPPRGVPFGEARPQDDAVSGPVAAATTSETSPRGVSFGGARPQDADVSSPVAAATTSKTSPRGVSFGGARPRTTGQYHTYPGRRVSCDFSRFYFGAI